MEGQRKKIKLNKTLMNAMINMGVKDKALKAAIKKVGIEEFITMVFNLCNTCRNKAYQVKAGAEVPVDSMCTTCKPIAEKTLNKIMEAMK